MIRKQIKIDGTIQVPVNVTEDKFEDLFLEWIEKNNFEFQGSIQDKSKS